MNDAYEDSLRRSLDLAEIARRQASAAGTPAVSEILRSYFEKSPDGMFISTVTGRFILVNAALGRLVGYPPTELMLLPTQSIYAQPSERRRFRGTIESAGRVNNFKLTLKGKNKAEIAVMIDAVVWYRSDGRTGGYVGEVRPAARSIEVRGRLSQYDLAIRGASEGLWSWDLKTDEVHYTARFKAILGYEEHEIHNTLHEWVGRVHPDDAERFKEALKAHLRGERDAFHCYYRMIHRDGEYRWMLARGVAQFSDDGDALRIGGSLSNVSSHMEIISRMKSEQATLASEKRMSEKQRDLFAQYIPPDLRAELADRGEEHASPRNQEAAVLVARIEEASFYHARLSAERFAAFLNEIVTDISDLVHGHGGVVARVEGDLLVCGFGMLSRHALDVDRCFGAAAAICDYNRLYNDVREAGISKAVQITIGISYGQLFSGTVGNVHRLEFATYGPPIKRAELLQSRCLRQGRQLLADRNAAGRVTGALELEEITVSGTSGPVKLYTLPAAVMAR